MLTEGVVRACRFGGSAPERAAAEPPLPRSLLLTAGGCAQLSRDAPPPLPGGYKVGEKLFFMGTSQTVSTGDKIVHGQQGEVTRPATAESVKGKGVDVLFPGNNSIVSCTLDEVPHHYPYPYP